MSRSKYARRKRDWAYLAWIRTLHCLCCGTRYRVEAAHVGPRAFGQKCPDNETLPLCWLCHREGKFSHHRLGKLFWTYWNIDRDERIQKLQSRYEEWKQAA